MTKIQSCSFFHRQEMDVTKNHRITAGLRMEEPLGITSPSLPAQNTASEQIITHSPMQLGSEYFQG